MPGNAAYWTAVAIAAAVAVAVCLVARRHPGRPARWIGRGIGLVLAADAVVFVLRPVVEGGWSVRGSLPLDLCDVALVAAAVTCWRPGWALGVELTYFWGLAGTLQAVLTPDLSSTYPRLEFFQFVVGHLGILLAVAYLVLGLGCRPRPGAVPRVFAITLGYTAAVAVVDVLTGANYMYLRHRPASASLLSLLGPWPWYVLGAAAVAYLLFTLLDLPWRRRAARGFDYRRPIGSRQSR